MQSKQLRIGITGGIGSGKTLASKYIESLGYPVIYADSVAKELYVSSKELKKLMAREFGKELLDSKGNISRDSARRIIFSSKKNTKRVNAIVHPFVIKEIDKLIREIKSRIVFIETAIMIESGYSDRMDYIILIHANKALRTKRVKARDGISASMINNIMSQQIDEREKMKRVDFIVCNTSTPAELRKSIKSLMKIINRL
ncbi:MAG: dephospho-CoA kinase [Ignavibacteria bacterium]|nr:dephospho-CoA kinase [Ignavibacteria bacterium]